MSQTPLSTRRRFLVACAAGTGASLFSGRAFSRGAPDALRTGHIGLGERGRALLAGMRGNAVALCDVDAAHLRKAAALAAPGTRLFGDYRELLARKDVDAVVVASPDHWHALHAVHACEAGKDVYLEVPLARTMAECAAIDLAATRMGRVVQTGSTGRFSPQAAALRQWLSEGRVEGGGTVRCTAPANPVGGVLAWLSAPPEGLDWDAWLGPARWRPYNPDYGHVRFRWDFSLGGGRLMGDGVHLFETILWCLGIEDLGRVRIHAQGEAPCTGLWDSPIRLEVTWQFDGLPWRIEWRQDEGVLGSQAVFETENAHAVLPCTDTPGHYGHVAGVAEASAPATAAASPLDEWQARITRRDRGLGGLPHAQHAAALAILGNLAYWLGREITWDSATGLFDDTPYAARLSQPHARGPWHL